MRNRKASSSNAASVPSIAWQSLLSFFEALFGGLLAKKSAPEK
jgi:hypothetical protein